MSTDSAEVSGRDTRLRQLREQHRFVLCLAVFVIAAAYCLRFSDGNALRLPWSDAALPATCASRLVLGVECPGCGLTRSFVALAAGDVVESYRFNRVGWLVALAVVVQIPYRIFALWELRRGVVERPWLAWLGYGLVVVLVFNWLLKLVGV